MDCYQISRFIKDRRMRDMSEELEDVRNFLKELKKSFNVPIYYKIGNHEDRWENFLRLQAPELLGIADFELRNVLRFNEIGIQEVKHPSQESPFPSCLTKIYIRTSRLVFLCRAEAQRFCRAFL